MTNILEPFVSQYASKWNFYIDKDVTLESPITGPNAREENFYDDFEYVDEEVDTVRLYAQYTADVHVPTSGSYNLVTTNTPNSDVPVNLFYQSNMSKMLDFTQAYVPQAHEGLIRIATDTFNTISNVFTDTASTITKLAGASSSSKSKEKEKEKEKEKSSSKDKAVKNKVVNKEVYITKSPPCIYVFDIVLVGRTWYRSLCYSSNVTMSFCSSIPRYITSANGVTSSKRCNIVMGDPSDINNFTNDPSLLIIRHNHNNAHAKGMTKKVVEYEMLVLPKLLYGLLPQVLLEEYQFWQNLKTSDLVGYPVSQDVGLDMEEDGDLSDVSKVDDLTRKNYLVVELVGLGPMDPGYFQQSEAKALVSRRNKLTDEVHYLVNLQNVKDATIGDFVKTLTRLDDLSHILAWSSQTGYTSTSEATSNRIDLIEYSKLGLTFRLDSAKVNSNRYVCDEYNGLYLNYGDVNASPLTSRLIRGLENSLLLSDDDGELYILVSTVRCPMRVYPNVPTSLVNATSIHNYLLGLGWPELVYDGHNSNWLNNLDTRHYLYKVHTSRCFLFVPTSSSLLYLLMCRFLDRQYEQVCRLSSNMIFDQVQNDESILYWSIISKIDSTRDTHPDAYASRLHILLAANKQGMTISKGINILTVSKNKFKRGLSTFKSIFSGQSRSSTSTPTNRDSVTSKDSKEAKPGDDDKIFIHWLLHEELCHYISLNKFVSAGCKLSVKEELDLLSLCQSYFSSLPTLSNRYYLLNSLKASSNTMIREHVVASDVELSVPSKPTVTNFDEVVDRSVVDKNLVVDAATSFTTLRYKKPQEMQSGPHSLEFIDKLLHKGMSIAEFMTVYELLLGVFPLSTFPNESTHAWGAILTRVISYKEAGSKNMMISTLKVLCSNPSISAHMPPCPEDMSKKKQFTAMFTRVHQPVHKFMGDLQRVFSKLDENKEINWDTTGRSVSRMDYVIKVDPVVPKGTLTTPWMFRSYSTDYGRTKFVMKTTRIKSVEITKELLKDMSNQLISHSMLSDLYNSSTTTPLHDDTYGFERNEKIPIDLDKHWIMKYDVCRKYFERLKQEYENYLNQQEQQLMMMSSYVGFDEQTVEESVNGDKDKLSKGVSQLTNLKERLLNLFKSDGQFIDTCIKTVLLQANSITCVNSNLSQLAQTSPNGWDNNKEECGNVSVGEKISKLGGSIKTIVNTTIKQGLNQNIGINIKNTIKTMKSSKEEVFPTLDYNDGNMAWSFVFGKLAELENMITFEHLVECFVSSNGDHSLTYLNPFISDTNEIFSLVSAIMLTVNRRIHVAKCISLLLSILQAIKRLYNLLSSTSSPVAVKVGSANQREDEIGLLKCEIVTSSRLLSEKLKVSRYYIKSNQNDTIEFDPRLLLFEFNCGILLYKRQVELVENFMKSAKNNNSCCHQMIMGEGKTTIVGPLLSLLLADGEKLFVQICPNSLLEFTRSTLRETFSAVIKKNVYTFKFTRFDKATPELYLKLLQAKQTRSVVIATPTSIKSLFLKVLYCFHKLESGELKQDVVRRVNNFHKKLVSIWNMTSTKVVDLAQSTASSGKDKSKKAKPKQQPEQTQPVNPTSPEYVYQRDVQLELDMCLRILELFNNAVLLMDEIDLLLHPLKSELHWPMGEKVPISHLNNSDFQIRWLLPWHILRVLYPNPEEQMGKGERFIFNRIRECIQEAVVNSYLSNFPHIILLSAKWYQNELLPLMVEWVYQFLRTKNLLVENYNEVYQYIVNKNVSSSLKSVNVLVFARDWLCSIFPHVITKVNQVNYGILSLKQIQEGLSYNPNMPQTRKMLAVPFVGKGTPARDSEFSHPDVLIGFTILSTIYQGLRFSDFVLTMRHLCSNFYQEPGKSEFRPSYKLFNKWLNSVGYYNISTTDSRCKNSYHYIKYLQTEKEGLDDKFSDSLDLFYGQSDFVDGLEEEGESDRIWCLDGVNVFDNEQLCVLYKILKNSTLVIEYYLCKILFPLAMEYCEMQMTATAQELGSSMLFSTRLGFSGTPSDLLPVEMNGCNFSPGVDGKMIAVTTDENVVSGPIILPVGWDSDSIINLVANSPDKPLALIDTGALITNYTNYEVARLLLMRGLTHVDGVVFLDDNDRQMILLRNKWNVTLLAHCGIPLQKRFSFYDQIHATGQDIKQAARAIAYVTIGPDMTFRDFAQGSWRMRGIGQGQTVKVVQPPEINQQITSLTGNKGGKLLFYHFSVLGCISWLLLKGLLNEVRLGRLLVEQCVENIARKKSFKALVQDHLNIGGNVHLGAHVQLFREFRDFSIANTFAPKVTLNRRILDFSARHQISHTQLKSITSFLNQEEIKDLNQPTHSSFEVSKNKFNNHPQYTFTGYNSVRTSNINRMEKTELFSLSDDEDEDLFQTRDEVKSEKQREINDYLGMEISIDDEFSMEAEHEQEMEVLEQEEEATQMREQMKEEEHITEEELPAPHSYSRSDEDLVYWSLNTLMDENTQLGFLRCRDFYLYRKDGHKYTLPFPDFLTISPNFYKIRWSSHTYRRMKNVLVVVDVFYPFPQERVYSQNGLQSPVPVNVIYDIMKGYEAFDDKYVSRGMNGKGAMVDIDSCLSILHAVDPEGPNEWELITEVVGARLNSYRVDNKTNMIGVNDFVKCIEELYSVDPNRRFIVVTLAEAEAIRAWLHKNKGTRTKIALRHLAAKFQPFDSSAVYAPKYFDKIQCLVGLQSRVVNSCLRFFNSEVQFSEAQMSILSNLFKNVNPQERLAFYQSLRETRLVIQNIKVAVSCCELLGKIFSSSTVDDFVIRILSLKFQHLMDQKGGAACLLSSLKCDRLSYSHVDKLMNPNPQKPLAKDQEIRAFFTLIDVDCDGIVSLEDLQNVYQEPSSPSILKSLSSVQFSLVKYKEIRLITKCSNILCFTAKRLTHIKSESVVVSHFFCLASPNDLSGLLDKVYINVLMLVRGSGMDLFTRPPLGYKMLWKDQEDPNMVLWEPQAPEGYSSLGLVSTRGNEPPKTCISCLPTKWLEDVQDYETIQLDAQDNCKLTLYISQGTLATQPPKKLMYDNFALQQNFFDDSNIPAILPL